MTARSPKERPDAYIGVRRRPESSPRGGRVAEAVMHRAKLVEAALCLATINASNNGFTSACMIREGDSPLVSTAMINVPEGNFHVTFSASSRPIVVAPTKSRVIARTELASIGSRSRWSKCIQMLLQQENKADPPVFRSLRRALCVALSACFEHGAAGGLLGIVTALEILLSDGDFRRLEERAASMLSDEPASIALLSKALKMRHEYVHRGASVGYNTTVETLPVLFNICEKMSAAHSTLPTCTHLWAYLDAKRAINKLNMLRRSESVDTNALGLPPWH